MSTRRSCAFWNLLGGGGGGVRIHCFLGNTSGMDLPLDTLKAEKNTIQVRWAMLYDGVYFEVSTFKIPSYLL